MTSLPASTKALAKAKPIPVAPPVINVIFPLIFMYSPHSLLHSLYLLQDSTELENQDKLNLKTMFER
jgi:hypothetical protein